MSAAVSLDAILAARERIAPHIRVTPMEPSASLSERSSAPVRLKLEHHQHGGSFKLRGATNAILSLSEAERARGVIGVSTGNHGRGLARAAARAGVRCVVAMSALVPQNKVAAIRAEGAEVLIAGRSQDEAQEEVDRLVRETGMTMIPPFDHPAVIAGQGTLGLEIVEAAPDVATVLVPLSGGGLLAGLGTALKAQRPAARLIGVSMARGAAMHASLAAGRPVEVRELATLADSLGGGIGLQNRHTFAMTCALVDEMVLLSEAEIADAIRHAYFHERQIVEGSGSVGIGAVVAGKVRLEGPAVVLVSGGNIDMRLHQRLIAGEPVDAALEAA